MGTDQAYYLKKGDPTFSHRTANWDKLQVLSVTVFKVEAKHSFSSVKKAAGEAAQGLPQDVFLAQRAER